MIGKRGGADLQWTDEYQRQCFDAWYLGVVPIFQRRL